MTAFFGRHYDSAIDARDWRRLKALERWAAVFNMPLLESKAHRALERITPKNHRNSLGGKMTVTVTRPASGITLNAA